MAKEEPADIDFMLDLIITYYKATGRKVQMPKSTPGLRVQMPKKKSIAKHSQPQTIKMIVSNHIFDYF